MKQILKMITWKEISCGHSALTTRQTPNGQLLGLSSLVKQQYQLCRMNNTKRQGQVDHSEVEEMDGRLWMFQWTKGIQEVGIVTCNQNLLRTPSLCMKLKVKTTFMASIEINLLMSMIGGLVPINSIMQAVVLVSQAIYLTHIVIIYQM